MLSLNAVGGASLANDVTFHEQTTRDAATAVAASAINRIAVFSGNGADDESGVFARLYSATGTPSGQSFRVNSTIQGEQHSAAVAAAVNGSFIVVWAGRGVGDREGIFFQRYSAAGAPLGEETRANQTTGGVQAEPAIAIDADGSFVVAWSGVGGGDVGGVFARRFSATGEAQSNEIRINTTTTDEQVQPSVAIDSARNLIIAWMSRHQDGSDWGVFGQRFSAAGARVGGEFAVNSTTAGSQTSPTIATDTRGNFFVAWSSFGQDGDGWGIVGRRFGSDGLPFGAELLLNDFTTGQQQNPNVAIAPGGHILVGWESGAPDGSGWEVRLRDLPPTGAAAASQVVNTPSGLASGWQHSPAIAVDGESAMVLWSGSGALDSDGVYVRQFNVTLQDPPVLATIPAQPGVVGTPLVITVTATDPNPADVLTFTLDPQTTPAGMTIERVDNNTARIRWTPTTDNVATRVRVIVTDNGVPPLSDTETLLITTGTATGAGATASSLDAALEELV